MMNIHNSMASLKQNNNNNIKIQELSSNTALYFDNIGRMNLINSSWNLYIYYDFTEFYDELKKLKVLIDTVENKCAKFNYCRVTFKLLKRKFNKIYNFHHQDNSLLKTKILPTNIFSNNGRNLEENLINFFYNQTNIDQLLIQHMSVIDSTNNILNDTTHQINNSIIEFEKLLKFFNSNEFQNPSNAEWFFYVIIGQLTIMLDNCYISHTSIINMLTEASHGNANPNLITDKKLQEALSYIKKFLPKNMFLPGQLTGNELKEVWNSMKINVIMIENYVVIQAEIPLLNNQISEIYKAISLPVKIENSTVISSVDDYYIVYNFEYNKYSLMSQIQLNICTKNVDVQFNCLNNFAWKSATERSCEISALKQSRHAECNFKEIEQKNSWIKLSTENQWLFTLFDRFNLSVHCENHNRSWIILPHKGILILQPRCVVQHEGIVLFSSTFYTSKQHLSLKSLSWKIGNTQIKNIILNPLFSIFGNNSKYIEKLYFDIDTLNTKFTDLSNIKVYTVSGNLSLFVILCIILAIVLIYIKKKYYYKEYIVNSSVIT